MKSLMRFGLVTGLIVASMANYAQPATPEQKGNYANKSDYGVFHMQTNLGSFKIIDGEGRIEFTFAGTVLLTKHTEGEMKVLSGKLRKEYDKNGRAVYTGSGKLLVTGKWRGLQWFGSDMTGVWYGKGFARITGEFDKNLNTGSYWYEDPSKKMPFPSSSVISLAIPPTNFGADLKAPPKPNQGGTAGGGN